jgi:hypothetical protein
MSGWVLLLLLHTNHSCGINVVRHYKTDCKRNKTVFIEKHIGENGLSSNLHPLCIIAIERSMPEAVPVKAVALLPKIAKYLPCYSALQDFIIRETPPTQACFGAF